MRIALTLVSLLAVAGVAHAYEVRGGALCQPNSQSMSLLDIDTGNVWGGSFQNWDGPTVSVTCPLKTEHNQGSARARVYVQSWGASEPIRCNIMAVNKFGIPQAVGSTQSGPTGGTSSEPNEGWLDLTSPSIPTYGTAIVICTVPERQVVGTYREM